MGESQRNSKLELERLNRELGYRVAELETILSLVPVGIAFCEDSECEVVRVNRVGGELLGVPENTNIGLSGADCDFGFSIRSSENPNVPAELPISEALESGTEVVDRPLRVVRSDGSRMDILVSVVPLTDEHGRARGAIAAFVDATGHYDERRRLEALRHAERIVSRLGIDILSEHDIDVILDLALTALTRDLCVELAAFFERRPEGGDLILRTHTGSPGAHPDRMVLGTGLEIDETSTLIVEDLRQDQRVQAPAWLTELGVVSLMMKSVHRAGAPFGVLAIFGQSPRRFSEIEIGFFETVVSLVAGALDRDRTERMLADMRDQLTLADARQAAERAEQLASLGTLAAGISHEINNPLNSILVNAELGLLKLDADQNAERIRSVLETIVEDVQRCARITESVLNLARSSDTPRESTDFNDIVIQARDLVASHLQLHEASVNLELGEIPRLRLDSNAMESAMVNLLRNAAESGREGVTICVETRRAGGEVVIVVRDDGPGIGPDHLDHIFDPFYSTKRSDKGTGLGLSLVHRTVTDHGGTIRVDSQVGEGTAFTIRLPVCEDSTCPHDEASAG